MNIGIVVPFINNFGVKGFYNAQEIGLAKALITKGNKVTIYKLTNGVLEVEKEYLCGITIVHCPAKKIGSNGMMDTKNLNVHHSLVLCFADLQLIVPTIYKWCKKHGTVFIPYIGVTESHSDKKQIQFIMNVLFRRNIKIYQRCICLAKNEDVVKSLKLKKVENVHLAPVGLDLDLVFKNYASISIHDLKKKYGYGENEKIILFVGRLEQEKEPLKALELFTKIYMTDPSYRFIIIGKGILSIEVEKEIKNLGMEDIIRHISSFPNQDIWQMYRISDCFINLNKKEIFGMAILEAMYYETKTIAWRAPGPNLIIDNGITGYLVNTEEEFIKAVMATNTSVGKLAHEKIMSDFTWDKTASIVSSIGDSIDLGT